MPIVIDAFTVKDASTVEASGPYTAVAATATSAAVVPVIAGDDQFADIYGDTY